MPIAWLAVDATRVDTSQTSEKLAPGGTAHRALYREGSTHRGFLWVGERQHTAAVLDTTRAAGRDALLWELNRRSAAYCMALNERDRAGETDAAALAFQPRHINSWKISMHRVLF